MRQWAHAKDALAYIESRQRFGVKPGLERTHRLLDLLGRPDRGLSFAHVAGTNGKGSTCALLAYIMQAAGYRTGLYTSPYLSAFGDRMSVNGVEIEEDDLLTFTSQVKTAIDGDSALQADPPTEFEVTTAIALLYFRAQRVDIVVWETGLGGRYDATNVVDPVVTAITNVDLDHTEVLGRRVEQIAFDKAGIAKPDRVLVTGATGAALRVIDAVANAAGAQVRVLGRDFRCVIEASRDFSFQRFSYIGTTCDLYGLTMRLLGAHQGQNAAVALAMIEVLRAHGFDISQEAIRSGLQVASWPGRLEVLASSPTVLVDGAHNPHGARALVQALQTLRVERIVLVAGVLADKDVAGILAPLCQLACAVFTTQAHVARAASAADVAQTAKGLVSVDIPVIAVPEVADCVTQARAFASTCAATVVVMGSLYTVAEARKLLRQPDAKVEARYS